MAGESKALSVWTSEFGINRFGMELLMYGFVFGLTGVIQLQIRAQREAMRSLELQRQLSDRAPARAADATGAAFPLQHLECHHDAG